MSSKGKSSGYLYRCSEGAESFSVRLAKPGRAEVREKSGCYWPSERFNLQGNEVGVKELFVGLPCPGRTQNHSGHDSKWGLDLVAPAVAPTGFNTSSKPLLIRGLSAAAGCVGARILSPYNGLPLHPSQ
jgi:hypothetical protein